MLLSPFAFAVLGLFTGAWLAVAVYLAWRGRMLARAAAPLLGGTQRLESLLGAGPAVPVLIRRDGSLDAPPRLAGLIGLESVPDDWDALIAAAPLDPRARTALAEQVAAGRVSGAPVSTIVRLAESPVILNVSGGPAPPEAGAGALLLWIADVTESEGQAATLRARLDRRSAALQALSGLIEAAPFPMWHRGPDLKLAMVNGAYVAAVEGEDAAAVIRSGIELIDEADGADPAAVAAQVRETKAPAVRVVPATIAGERRTLRIVEVPLGPNGVAGFAIDVEDQEQARAELSRFGRAQRDMLDRLSAGVAQFGRDRALTFFNQPFARLFALTADFLADHPEFDRVIDAMRGAGRLPEVRDFPDWKEERRGWFTAGLAADEEDWLLPGGKHLRVVAQPLPDGGLLVIFEDRTEQIQLASARDTLLRVRTATFDNLFEAVGVFASDGRLHLWNNRFRDLWQFEEEQLASHPRIDGLTRHIGKLLKKPSHATLVRELVRSATIERKQRAGRVSLIDGREFEFAAVPLPDGNALFTMLDVTDSRRVETALRDRNEALEEADRLKTAFVANMSYELRTPLTSIAGFAEMLAGGYAGGLPPVATDYVTAILDSVARLSALIDNVLDLTQSDMGSLLLAEDEIDVAELCAEAVEAKTNAAGAKGVDIAIEADDSAGLVTGDRRRLGQALANLLDHALRATPAGGAVALKADGAADEAVIRIADGGRGLDLADQARLFDRFHRSADGAGGDGLGLPLAKQFVEAHGGSVDLVSGIDHGTVFTVRLPRTADQREAFAASDPAPSA